MKKTLFLALGLACAFVGAGVQGVSRAAVLGILETNNQVILFWPTGAVGYTLEFATALGADAGWAPSMNPPAVVGPFRFVTNAVSDAAQFYRLAAPAATAPGLTGPTVSGTSLPFGSTSVVSFAYFDPDSDILAVEVTSSNALGVTVNTLPAAWLRISGTDGPISLPFNAGDLPFGASTFRLQLKDSLGGTSAAGAFTLELTGAMIGGTAPVISEFTPQSLSLNRPTGPADRVRVLCTYSYQDPEADIERVRVRITDPSTVQRGTELSKAAHKISGPQGTVTAALFSFAATNMPGTYAFELSLIDVNGNESAPATAFVELTEAGGDPALSIAGFLPSTGAAGTLVNVYGSGFDPIATNNLVTLSAIPVPVMASSSGLLTIAVPAEAWTGNFEVRNSNGIAFSAAQFVVPTSLSIEPSMAELAVGEQEQFETTAVSAPSHLVNWSVSGVAGGNSLVGLITEHGLYSAPMNVPTGEVVTVTATLVNDPGITAQARIRILSPRPAPGAALVLASVGGTVSSEEGAAMVLVPPQALSSNAVVSVQVLKGTNVPPAQAGQRILSAIQLGPEGTIFNSPVTLVLPLAVPQPAGTQLPVQFFEPPSGLYVDEGTVATVATNQRQAVCLVPHFSIVVAQAPLAIVPPTPPIITSIYPLFGQEGKRVPVLFQGSGLTFDLEIEILTNNVATDEVSVVPGSFVPLGEQAGALLSIRPIPGLNEGGSRNYTIRLRRIGSAIFSETNFIVHGLNEFIVGAGETRQVAFSDNRRYSTIHVEANGSVVTSEDIFDIESTSSVIIDGAVLAHGDRGETANLDRGGAQGTSSRFGGRGGRGREDEGCFEVPIIGVTIDPDPYDCAELINFGGEANLFDPTGLNSLGAGGAPGQNVNLLTEAIDAISHAIECAGTLGLGCVQLAVDVYEVTDDIINIAAGGPVGRQGFPGVPPVNGFGNGGGGGGGGGRFSAIGSSINGGGGGAGGDGGRPVRIVTGRELRLGGVISTAGGTGGDGSDDGERIPVVNISVGYTGGGGGGGSGGLLTLTAGDGIVRAPGRRHIFTEGGTNGFGGIREVDASGRSIRKLIFRSNRRAHAAGGGFRETNPLNVIQSAATPVFFTRGTNGLIEADDQVTTRGLLRVRFRDDRVPLNLNHSFVSAIQGTTTNQFMLRRTPSFEFSGYVRLAPGFNTLAVQGMHELLQKEVLFLGGTDSDGDGLYDADEADFGTNANDSDTDDDGLNDLDEILAGADPLNPDTDGDCVLDGQEVSGASPISMDTDGDGRLDGVEILQHTAPAIEDGYALLAGTIFGRVINPNGDSLLALVDPASGAIGVAGSPNGGTNFSMTFGDRGNLIMGAITHVEESDTPLIVDAAGKIPMTRSFDFQLGPGQPIKVGLLAFNPDDCASGQELFAVELQPDPPHEPTDQLLRVRLDTGLATRVGPVTAGRINALACWFDGRVYAAMSNSPASDQLVLLNTLTGARQVLGNIGFAHLGGLTFSNNVLYGTAVTNGVGVLLAINAASAASTVITTTGKPVYDLAIATDPIAGFNRPLQKFWYPNGPVSAIAEGNGVVYLGGAFSYVGPATGPGTVVDATTGAAIPGQVVFEGNPASVVVNAAAPDGAGGWYVSGDFETANCVSRTRLAHILSDGTVDPVWNPFPTGHVIAIAVVSNTVYVGGGFFFVGGATRRNVAALDAATGLATAWNPNPNAASSVYSLLVDGSTLYVGGNFTNIGGAQRTYLAAIDTATGSATAWNPNLLPASFGRVSALAISGNTVFAGGLFGVNGSPANTNLAGLDQVSAASRFPTLSANSIVRALAATNGVVYAGGDFTLVNGVPRAGVAALDAASGVLTPWNPSSGAVVNALLISGPRVYVGGGFASMGGERRNNLAAVDALTGLALTAFATGSDGQVSTFAVAGNRLFVGGEFTSAGGVIRRNAAALSTITGAAMPWNPDLNAPVTAIAVTPNAIYLGGYFTNAGGLPRAGLASAEPGLDGAMLPWDPQATYPALTQPRITALAISPGGSVLYAKGHFDSIRGVTNRYIAALETFSGSALRWNSATNAIGVGPLGFLAIGRSGCGMNTVYVPGHFDFDPNQIRPYVAELSGYGAGCCGDPTLWNPELGSTPTALAVDCSAVYAAGMFPVSGGMLHQGIAVINGRGGFTTVPLDAINQNGDAGEFTQTDVDVAGKYAYVCGDFVSVQGQQHQNVAAVCLPRKDVMPWSPIIGASSLYQGVTVTTIKASPAAVYVGGSWGIIGGKSRPNFAVFRPMPEQFCK